MIDVPMLRATARGLTLSVALVSAALGGAAAQQTGSIRGTVASASTGAPIGDADVFMEGTGRRATSNRSGRFQFVDLGGGQHTLVVERLGFGTVRQEVTVQPGQAAEVTIVLEDQAISVPGVVVIASRSAKDLSEVAASVGVIGGSAIRDVNPTHPSEIMGQIPGVYVNVTGGEGHMTAIRQPLSTSPVYLYLEDGIPTRSTGFFNHNALYEVNVPQSDRVEVMKGPANAMYGSDAIGGVVNVGTRAPSEDLEGELSIEGGEHGFQQYLGSVGGTVGGNGLRGDLNLTTTDGWRVGSDYTRYSGTARWDRSVGSNSSLKTVVTYSNIDQNTAGSSAISRADFDSNPTINYTPISYRKVTALRVSSAFEKQTESWSWSLTSYARDNSMELLPNWSLTYDPTVYRTENKSVGLLAKGQYDLPGVDANLTIGIDTDYSPGSYFERSIAASRTGSVFDSYTVGAAIYDYDVSFHEIAPWLQAELTPTERLHLSAGVRGDFLGYDYTNTLGVETTGAHRRPGDASPTFNAISPKFGVAFSATRQLDVFASYRRGFRAPDQGQLFRQGSAESTVDLEPVKADSWETGLRGRAGQRIRYELSAYYMTMTDDILSYRLPDGTTQSVNAGETLHKGIEVGLGVQLVPGLNADVAYSYAVHTYEEWSPNESTDYSGNEQEFAPREVGSARLEIAPPAVPGSRLTLEWSRIGPYWMDAENANEYEGHDLFNVRAAYAVSAHLDVFAKLNNVFGERYAERASYNAFRGEELAPGLPRTFYFGVRVR
jgi:outer membrane receptor protein involved in Fe transport